MDIKQKPTSILMKELMSELRNTINNSRLPLCVVEFIVKDIYIDVQTATQKQYAIDIKNYQDSQEAMNTEE